MSNIITVVAAVYDEQQLTLYKVDGEKEIIQQGDPRLQKILQHVIPTISSHGKADVDLSECEVEELNSYNELEKKSNGLVRFFKVAKEKLAKIFNIQDVQKGQYGIIPEIPEPKAETYVDGGVTVTSVETVSVAAPIIAEPVETIEQKKAKLSEIDAKNMAAVDEILKNAKPSSHKQFTQQTKPDETVIAVVNGKVIPEVEKIQNQITHAASNENSSEGMIAFMDRISKVISKRRHPVEDLIKFLEKGDLPIANDGSFIAYKVLRRGVDKRSYVDCHTGNVPQRVGSIVCMEPELVDQDRRNECSSGLHVARRKYVGGFSGDVCVLIRVNPEDVIAVPNYDANKMRVCAYEILHELTAEQFNRLKNNQAITDTTAGKVLLGRALAGDFPAPIEQVKIGGHRGTKIEVTPITDRASVRVDLAEIELTEALPVEPGEVVKATAPNLEKVAADVAVAKEEVAAAVDAVVVSETAATEAEPVMSRKDKIISLYNTLTAETDSSKKSSIALEMLVIKKAAKVSWVKLGLPADFELVADKPDSTHAVENAASTPAKAPKPSKKVGKPAAEKKLPPEEATALDLMRNGVGMNRAAKEAGITRSKAKELKDKFVK